MANKKALIVDDSKLALFVLKKMLAEFGVDADTTQSGEEALGYLAHKHPDVIFLDHTMPGMQGLQVLQVIKDNPEIADIPVMMYTSKEDYGYIKEAKALGAVDILPKQLKPAVLRDVLHRLALVEQEEGDAPNSAATSQRPAQAATAGSTSQQTPLTEKEEITGLLREAESALEKESLKQFIDQEFQRYFLKYRSLARQATRHLESKFSETVGGPSLVGSALKTGLSLCLLFVVVFIVYSHTSLRTEMHTLQSNLMTLADAQGIVIDLGRADVEPPSNKQPELDALLDLLAQSANELSEVPYGQALSGEQLNRQLLDWLLPLNLANYQGELQIQVSAGRFCLIANSDGRFILPKPETLTSGCQVMDYPMEQEAAEWAALQRFIAEINNDENNHFRVSLIKLPFGQERFSYPNQESSLTAGEWNAVAQKNHRIDYVFR